tara:strand:+ start:117 stop:992 length:876 start_codon:yes stop_codon:yes gene_type:complete
MAILEKGFGLDYAIKYKNGEIKKGLGISCPITDKFVRFKPGQMVVVSGFPNVGKTYFFIWYLLCHSINNKLKWCVWSGENSPELLKISMIQMLTGQKVEDLSESEIKKQIEIIDTYFKFVDNRKLYTASDLLNIFAKESVDGCLIDPYTGLNIERGGKLGQFDRNYVFCNNVREFCNRTNKTIYINTHPISEAARRVYKPGHPLEGYVQPPKSSDIEGGMGFINRADDVYAIHRMGNHPEFKTMTELHVQKVKNIMTGGELTTLDEPLRFNFYNGYYTIGGNNPLKHIQNG